MELTINRLCLLLYICGVIHTGWSQKKCELQVESTQVFAPINEWILLNCTYTCSKPIWESRLQKRNTLEGDDWVSIEVLVNDWETSSISCISSDGEAPKSTVTVSAYALPTTVTIDLDEELEEGQQHEVTCTVFEVAPLANLQISVMREGKVIEMSTFARSTNKGKQSLSETYYFTVTRRDNLQGFYCQATLELGTVEDNAVQSKKINVKTFAIPELPVISITPARTVKEGESVTLTCQSEGFPEPEYSWEIPPNAHVTYSQDNSKVTITKATFAHKGSYLCMVKNKHGRVRGEESLDIINNPGAIPELPVISITPARIVKEGESVTLTCQSEGFPEPEYSWEIPPNAHVTYSQENSKVTITKATFTHKGSYLCMAKNKHGRVRGEEYLDIINNPGAIPQLPVISITPARTVKEDESVTLTCQSEGFPEPEYSWEIPPNAHVTYSQDNSKITITKATFAHKGSYLCTAKNKHGRVRGEESLDIINNPGAQPDTPFIMVLPHGTVKEGESLNLTCHSGGHPEPEYFWTIPSIEHVYFSADKTEIFITKATSAHNGTYQCEAQNTNGKVKNQLVIRIIGQSNGVFHTRPTAILLASLALLLALL